MKKYILYPLVLLLEATLLAWKASDRYQDNDLREISKVYAKYALDEHPAIMADTNFIAIWKMNEDTDPHNYFVLERFDYYNYVFTYMNREGSNRTYENMGAFFSNIGDTRFINVRYFNWETNTGGYFFLKVVHADSRGWDMDLALVADTTLKNITSAKEVRERIEKNVNNPSYFKKPVHFRKILPLMYCK